MNKLTQAYVRKYVHRHNSFSGAVRMAQMNMRTIAGAPTTTDYAKHLASDIADKLDALREALATRVDPK